MFIDGLALHYYTRIGDKNMTILQADGKSRIPGRGTFYLQYRSGGASAGRYARIRV